MHRTCTANDPVRIRGGPLVTTLPSNEIGGRLSPKIRRCPRKHASGEGGKWEIEYRSHDREKYPQESPMRIRTTSAKELLFLWPHRITASLQPSQG